MKKFNSPYTIITVLFVMLFFSIGLNYKFINLSSQQRKVILALHNEDYKIREYKEALRLADTIMDNNDVWDMDGSDVMSDYLDLRCAIDTAFYSGFHDTALIDSLIYNYNEK